MADKDSSRPASTPTYTEPAVNQHKRMAATGKPNPGNGTAKPK